jgi:hypothetical protein
VDAARPPSSRYRLDFKQKSVYGAKAMSSAKIRCCGRPRVDTDGGAVTYQGHRQPVQAGGRHTSNPGAARQGAAPAIIRSWPAAPRLIVPMASYRGLQKAAVAIRR